MKLASAVLGAVVVLLSSTGATSQEPPSSFDQLALVLLMRGPAADTIPEADLPGLQRGHLAFLTAMGESGRLVVAGPFGDQDDDAFRGLCLYRVSTEEARRLAESDPAVRAGRLRVEVMTWYFESGALEFPLAPALDADDDGGAAEPS